jgi:hypothetical protein
VEIPFVLSDKVDQFYQPLPGEKNVKQTGTVDKVRSEPVGDFGNSKDVPDVQYRSGSEAGMEPGQDSIHSSTTN